jgi:AraC-like DNA-binding protein
MRLFVRIVVRFIPGCGVDRRRTILHKPMERGATMIANPISDRIISYVESNYDRPISLRDVASMMGYSPCHLTTVFRRATGTPITAWIVKRRIEAARQLLAVGTISVAQACEMAGFSDLCYFTRQFVRHVGTTPGRFRATAQITVSASSMARS